MATCARRGWTGGDLLWSPSWKEYRARIVAVGPEKVVVRIVRLDGRVGGEIGLLYLPDVVDKVNETNEETPC